MQPIIVAHILSRYLDAYIGELAKSFPFQPLSAVQNNYLRMSENGQTPRIEDFSRKLYDKIKELELEDDPPFRIEHKDGTVEENKPEVLDAEDAKEKAFNKAMKQTVLGESLKDFVVPITVDPKDFT